MLKQTHKQSPKKGVKQTPKQRSPKQRTPKQRSPKQKSPKRTPKKSPKKVDSKENTICCETTIYGLNLWFKNKFEKLGWMLLAKKHGYMDKVKEYKNSVGRLEKAIKHRLTHIVDLDEKMDLQIMLKNVHILEEHIKSDKL